MSNAIPSVGGSAHEAVQVMPTAHPTINNRRTMYHSFMNDAGW